MQKMIVKLDEDASRKIKEVKQYLREQGISATFSDAVRELYRAWKEEREWI